MNKRRFALRLLILLAALAVFPAGASAEGFSLPEDTREIQEAAFLNCESLTGELILPPGITSVGAYAFAGCTGLTGTPQIPDTVLSIGPHAFDGCASLSGTLYLPPDMDVDETAFDNCPLLIVTREAPAAVPRVAMLVEEEPGLEEGAYNLSAYRAAHDFCQENEWDFDYFMGDDALDDALSEGFDVIIVNSFMYEEAIADVMNDHPGVRFICIDMTIEDQADNVFCASYRFMAGYAAVKLGYRHLAFLGGIAVPGVVRYGTGFVQGANQAAVESGVTGQVAVEYTYTGAFWPTDEAQQAVYDWFTRDGVDVVFCCGGNQCESAALAGRDAAASASPKFIGVDVDQQDYYNGFVSGSAVTSALKAMGATVDMALQKIFDDEWDDLGGQNLALGVVSETPEENHVGLAPSTQFGQGFSADEYTVLLRKLLNGTYDASSGDVQITVNQN